MTKVRIDSPGITIEVEADDPLDACAAKALALFEEAGGWPRRDETTAFGFTAERRPHPAAQPSSMPGFPHPYPIQGKEGP